MKTLSLGELTDQIHAHSELIDAKNAELKVLEKEEALMKEQLLNLMLEAGTDIVRGEVGTASITKYTRPKIDDPVKAFAFIKRTGNLQLFERRIAPNAYKELMEQRKGKAIPGLSLYEEDRVHVRKRAAKS